MLNLHLTSELGARLEHRGTLMTTCTRRLKDDRGTRPADQEGEPGTMDQGLGGEPAGSVTGLAFCRTSKFQIFFLVCNS